MIGKITVLLALASLAYAGVVKPKIEVSFKKIEKIVGGEIAPEGEMTSIVSQITINAAVGHTCGGSIYNDRTIITAAHCCDAITPFIGEIVGGEYNRLTSSDDEQYRNIGSFVKHPDYGSPDMFNNDICLIFLDQEELYFDKGDVTKPSPIALATEEVAEGTPLTLYGWGATEEITDIPLRLHKVQMSVSNQEQCKETYAELGAVVTDSMICVGGTLDEGACNGDSGGPIVDANGAQVGIVSWGTTDCGLEGYPSVFVKVSKFVDWIEQEVANHFG